MPRGIGRAKERDPGFQVGGAGSTVEVIQVADSGKAVQVRMPDNDEMWFPFSQIHADSEITEDNCEPETEATLVVTTWIAGKKGLVDGDGF